MESVNPEDVPETTEVEELAEVLLEIQDSVSALLKLVRMALFAAVAVSVAMMLASLLNALLP